MTETESKATEIETDKENMKPENKTKEIATDKENVKSANVKSENDNDNEDNEIDSDEFTEHKIFSDMQQMVDDGEIKVPRDKKGDIRLIMSKKYNLDEQLLKKHKPYKNAWKKIKIILQDNLNEQEELKEQEMKEQEEENENENNKKKKSKKKDEKKKSKKKKKSRKRKRPSSDDDENENNNDENECDDPPKKKRKKNKNNNRKKNSKKNQQKPGEWTLKKLKKLLKATNLANPKLYKKLNEMKIKKQIEFIKELLSEKNVPTDTLSDVKIKEIAKDFALKKEMQELNMSRNNINNNECGRGKRKRNNVSYIDPPVFDKNNDGSDNDHNDNDNDVEIEEEEDESDAYEPDDDDYSDQDYNDDDD